MAEVHAFEMSTAQPPVADVAPSEDGDSPGQPRLATESEMAAVAAAESAPLSKAFYIKRVGYNDMVVRLHLHPMP